MIPQLPPTLAAAPAVVVVAALAVTLAAAVVAVAAGKAFDNERQQLRRERARRRGAEGINDEAGELSGGAAERAVGAVGVPCGEEHEQPGARAVGGAVASGAHVRRTRVVSAAPTAAPARGGRDDTEGGRRAPPAAPAPGGGR